MTAQPAKEIASDVASITSNPVRTHVPGPAAIVLVGHASLIKEVATSTAQRVFPEAQIIERVGLSEISTDAASPTGFGTLLVLRETNPAIIAKARSQLDETGLPRWAVVEIRGSTDIAGDESGDVIAENEINPTLLGQIFRSAWERHQLRRSNCLLRGYLMTFGSRIAHDLRTPLGGILTTTEMLREILAEDAPADVPLTQPILDSTDGLVKLIERTSFFARATASSEPSRTVDMAMPFWGAYQQLERLIIQAQVTFEHPPSWPKVPGHESWLEIVWCILLRNALQHSPTGSRIAAGWSEAGPTVRFWIRSEGTVPAEKRASLFFPFQRLHEPGAPRGLGLSIMRGLVELEGGSCGLEPTTADGAEFFFCLPSSSERDPTTG
jgi:signal transduction histidine kinase